MVTEIRREAIQGHAQHAPDLSWLAAKSKKRTNAPAHTTQTSAYDDHRIPELWAIMSAVAGGSPSQTP
jgi:hypothetical protein